MKAVETRQIRDLTETETSAVAGGMLHALLPAAAIIVVGAVLIGRELSREVEPEAPDLTGIPPTPEEL
jgi:hypothetical protein